MRQQLPQRTSGDASAVGDKKNRALDFQQVSFYFLSFSFS